MYIPGRGDLIWLNFSPQKGHEQKGKRPAFVISPKAYNQKTNLALCCPISSYQKGYSFEVPIHSQKIKGVILADQIKSLDWKARKAKFIEKSQYRILKECLSKIYVLIE